METANKNNRYFEFYKAAMGKRYFLDGKEISKSSLFWMKENLSNDLKRATRITGEAI